jgi:hypothetical protein
MEFAALNAQFWQQEFNDYVAPVYYILFTFRIFRIFCISNNL